MKKLALVLLALIVVGVSSMVAEELPKNEKELVLDTSTEFETIKVATKVPVMLKQAIVNELVYPEQARYKDLEGQVYMRICVCPDSKIKIVALNATNPYLGKYVKKELASLKVKNPGCEPGQVYLLKVDFDLLN